MKPYQHIAVSFSLGAGFLIFTKSWSAGLVCFLAGLLLDIDHAFEYIFHYGLRGFSWNKCYQACVATSTGQGKQQFTKIRLIFHSFELAIAAWVVAACTKNMYFIAACVGYSVHLALDHLGNRQPPLFYFLIWRAIHHFTADRIMRKRPR